MIAKHVLCVWHPKQKKWIVNVTLADGTIKTIEYTRSRSRNTSIKKIVKNVLESEGLTPYWDMRYGWKTAEE